MRLKRKFCLKTHRSFSEYNGKYSFVLYSKKSLLPLLQCYNKGWCKTIPGKGMLENVLPKSGVYAIVMNDPKTRSKEICYIGSSKNVALRLSGHPIISFLRSKLTESYNFYIYFSYNDNHQRLEKELLRNFRPFLNINVQVANHFIYY